MTKVFERTLGSIVRDRISGYQGVLTVRTEWYLGPILYNVQSREIVEGVPVEARVFDEDTLEVVEEKPDVPPKFKYELGAKARDTVTGLEGIIVCRSQHVHQCHRYNLQQPGLNKGVPYKSISVDEAAIELLEAPAKPAKKAATGCVVGASETTESRK